MSIMSWRHSQTLVLSRRDVKRWDVSSVWRWSLISIHKLRLGSEIKVCLMLPFLWSLALFLLRSECCKLLGTNVVLAQALRLTCHRTCIMTDLVLQGRYQVVIMSIVHVTRSRISCKSLSWALFLNMLAVYAIVWLLAKYVMTISVLVIVIILPSLKFFTPVQSPCLARSVLHKLALMVRIGNLRRTVFTTLL